MSIIVLITFLFIIGSDYKTQKQLAYSYTKIWLLEMFKVMVPYNWNLAD